MKTAGIIVEYNPFHNGHLLHLQKTREATNADYVIAVMSGDFVQRGEPAIVDKYTRTAMALSCGCDMVLELPVRYATGSAEAFAFGGISTLSATGIVDNICFGSESGDITVLTELANLYRLEPEGYRKRLVDGLKNGETYPAARANATKEYLGKDQKQLDETLSAPNNILGIEYAKAIDLLKSKIEALTFKREGSNYHDTSLSTLPSSTAIRSHYLESHELSICEEGLPALCYEMLAKAEGHSFPILSDDFTEQMYYALLHDRHHLWDYMDVSPDQAERIQNLLESYTTFSSFADQLKTKQYTLTRIKRSLLHIMLGIHKEQLTPVPYIRVLGLRKDSSELLRYMREKTTVPILCKLAQDEKYLTPEGMTLLAEDQFATMLYNRVLYTKFGTLMPNEYKQGMILI